MRKSGGKGTAQAVREGDKLAQKAGADSWEEALDHADRQGYLLSRAERRIVAKYRKRKGGHSP